MGIEVRLTTNNMKYTPRFMTKQCSGCVMALQILFIRICLPVGMRMIAIAINKNHPGIQRHAGMGLMFWLGQEVLSSLSKQLLAEINDRNCR